MKIDLYASYGYFPSNKNRRTHGQAAFKNQMKLQNTDTFTVSEL